MDWIWQAQAYVYTQLECLPQLYVELEALYFALWRRYPQHMTTAADWLKCWAGLGLMCCTGIVVVYLSLFVLRSCEIARVLYYSAEVPAKPPPIAPAPASPPLVSPPLPPAYRTRFGRRVRANQRYTPGPVY